jgi:hypothetical protein
MGDEPPGRRWRPAAALAALVAVTAIVGVLIAVLQRPPTHAPMRPMAIATPTPIALQAPPSLNLSGTWAGLCTGSFNGFCSLTWTQTAHALDGTFMLSSPPGNLHISGNLTGSTISFGAGGVATFTGTVSGSSMSGSYTDIANGKTGSWTVTLSA